MKLSLSFLSTLLVLATSTTAHPARDQRRAAMLNQQIANKHAALMAEKLAARKPTATKTLSPPPAGAASGLATSTATFGPGGFAGPLVGGSTITTIKANLTVPTVQIPPNGQTSGLQYGFAAWVGIQGTGALWQTGIFATVSGSNDPEYSLFYDWFPEGGAASFSNGFTFGAGDEIYMTVTAGSSTSGTALVEKVSTGETATVTLTGMSTIGGRSTGDFIVEDYGNGYGNEPFGSWTPAIQFTGCSFSDDTGSGHGISGYGYLEVTNGDNTFTSTTGVSNHAFSVSYIGNANYS